MRRHARWSAAVLTAALVGTGCATKEITLTFGDAASEAPDVTRDGGDGAVALPDAAAGVMDAAADPTHFPIPFCLSFVDSATGESCMRCYDEWGAELSRTCKLTKCTAGDDSSSATRCLYCDDAPEKARACLKCEGIPSAGECVVCNWSDNAAACRRCADAAGTLDYAGCDALRSELGQR